VSLPGTVKWVLLALIGLAIAIGVAIAAANLTSQQIGIASESVSAGDTLAPALHVPAEQKHGESPGHHPEETTTGPSEPPTNPLEETLPSEEPAEPPSGHGGDDSGGHASDGDD
jgi:hypothetical protein